MIESKKAEPKSVKQRQAAFKARQREEGLVEIAVWVKANTNEKLSAKAFELNMTKGQVIDDVLENPIKWEP